MKSKANKILIPLAAGVLLLSGATLLFNNKEVRKVEAVNLPTTINLKDNTSDEIKAYYSSLSSLGESELKGDNLLKNLKGIIANNVTYYSYGQIEHAYPITDRDWTNSPASGIDGYNSSSKTISSYSYSNDEKNNPYIHMLYHDYSNASFSKTHYKGDGDVSDSTKSFDNEHAWSQTHGFADKNSKNNTGAGSDLHHLIAGTQYGNRTFHNNYSYGFVGTNDIDWSKAPTQEAKNKRGTPKYPHSQDQQSRVFEPQDCDKGDIARALLYMVACYNSLDGSTPTKESPALKLVNYVISENSTGFSYTNIEYGYYGSLSDILAWHKLDPVDDYEIHRNNLIYNNYQHNRNPFIDYPEWVDYIWGTVDYVPNTKLEYNDTPTGYVDLSKDVINDYRPSIPVTSLYITNGPTKTSYYAGEEFDSTGMVVMANLEDSSTMDITSHCHFEVNMTTGGTKSVRAVYGEHYADYESITVTGLTSIALTQLPNKTTYTVGDTFDRTGMVITATFDDSATRNVANSCIVEADLSTAGEKTVKVKYCDKTQTFKITVKEAEEGGLKIPKLYIIIGAAVVGVIVIILIFAGVLKVNKKGKVKVNKKQVKKIVKGSSKMKK